MTVLHLLAFPFNLTLQTRLTKRAHKQMDSRFEFIFPLFKFQSARSGKCIQAHSIQLPLRDGIPQEQLLAPSRISAEQRNFQSPIHIFDLQLQTTFNKSSDIALCLRISRANLIRVKQQKNYHWIRYWARSLQQFVVLSDIYLARSGPKTIPKANRKTWKLLPARLAFAAVSVYGCWNNENISCFSISLLAKRSECWFVGNLGPTSL